MWGSASPRKLEKLWHIDRVDFALAFITFALVLALDLLPAMIAGIVLSIVYVIYRISFPGRAVLGRVPKTGDYEAISWQYGQRSGTTDSKATPVPGVIVYRFTSPLVFSNAEAFKQTGEELLIEAGAKGELPHTVVIDFEEVGYIDTTGAAAITAYLEYAQRYGVDLALARVHSGTHKILQLTGDMDEIGEQRIFDTVRDAVDAAASAAASQNQATPTAAETAGDPEDSGS
jgi:SulP family sulfate permease